MTTTTIQVKGMTCGHCVSAVTEEISKVDGVTGVDVDLESGNVTIASEAPVDTEAVNAAVDEAGYEVVAQ
jgi:copper chaperone